MADYQFEQCPGCNHSVRVDGRRFAIHVLGRCTPPCRGSEQVAPSKMTWQEREAFEHHGYLPLGWRN